MMNGANGQRPEPDSVTKSTIKAAKDDRVATIAESKKSADLDSKKFEEAQKTVAKEAETSKTVAKEALKAEISADKAQKKLLTIRNNINKIKGSPEKGEVRVRV